jgi:DNA-binding XRE family transcriptional regulator
VNTCITISPVKRNEHNEHGSTLRGGAGFPPLPIPSPQPKNILKGRTQRDVAALAGISEAYLSLILSKKRVPAVVVASRLAKIFKLRIDQLYEALGVK